MPVASIYCWKSQGNVSEFVLPESDHLIFFLSYIVVGTAIYFITTLSGLAKDRIVILTHGGVKYVC